jgi:Kef-type K+ transport system membrane component KefB
MSGVSYQGSGILMRKIILFSVLLILGLAGSQVLPAVAGDAWEASAHAIKLATMLGLAFIMIHVGYEFDIDRSNLRQYGWDYLVAATAAAFPWLFCCLYFIFVMSPQETWGSWGLWQESLLASRFAAPTSAGVLFSMLAAAGLAATWMYHKARILAIFDDLDTVLLMIPLKMMIVGVRWQLAFIVFLMAGTLWLAWRYLHRCRIPITWPWVLGYATCITLVCELIYFSSKLVDEVVPIHIEVLLPAFVLGCVIARPTAIGGAEHSEPAHDVLETPQERRASTLVSAAFMICVGLSLPPLLGLAGSAEQVAEADAAAARAYVIEDEETLNGEVEHAMGPACAAADELDWGLVVVHVLAITVLSNLGKMFPLFCYRREVSWRERLAVAVAMFPRGEVGAGVLVISLSYGIGGPMIIVAMFSLALNLLCTGVFIAIVKALLRSADRE